MFTASPSGPGGSRRGVYLEESSSSLGVELGRGFIDLFQLAYDGSYLTSKLQANISNKYIGINVVSLKSKNCQLVEGLGLWEFFIYIV